MSVMRESNKRITKKQFYDLGGFSNPNLFRKQSGKQYHYFLIIKNY